VCEKNSLILEIIVKNNLQRIIKSNILIFERYFNFINIFSSFGRCFHIRYLQRRKKTCTGKFRWGENALLKPQHVNANSTHIQCSYRAPIQYRYIKKRKMSYKVKWLCVKQPKRLYWAQTVWIPMTV
jgi:hypothetical protein